MASEEKQAAIDMDSLGDKQLDQVSAADFLRALNAGGLSLTHYMAVWPEKKKVELFVEPENVGRVRVRDLIAVIRAEKKKRELEPFLDVGFGDPLRADQLIDRIAREVELRMRR
jgi:hypothetical protein